MSAVSLDSEVFDFDHSRMWVEDGILFVQYNQGLVIDLATAEAVIREREKLRNGRILPLMVDITGLAFVFTDARKLLNAPGSLVGVSVKALFSERPESSLVARFAVLFDEPACEVRVFEDWAEALGWLSSRK